MVCPTELDSLIEFSLYFLSHLPQEHNIIYHVQKICEDYGVHPAHRSFLAISLHRADKEKFELDFHNLERRILFDRGCVKKVIKLMKFIRDTKGGPMMKLWSHLLKVRS